MKKNLLKGMMVLFASTAFVACSHDTDFTEVSADNIKNQYREAFVKKYGEINPNQSWDFTNAPAQARMTRSSAKTPELTWDKTYLVWKADWVSADYDKVKSAVADENIKPQAWPYDLASIVLYPYYTHGVEGEVYNYFKLGFTYSYNNSTASEEVSVNAANGFWYTAGGYGKEPNGTKPNTMNWNSYIKIDTRSMIYADSYSWWLYYQNGSDDNIIESYTKNLSDVKVKIFTVNTRKYVAFDCKGDGNYDNLICRVDEKFIDTAPQNIEKRYMVEDLGSFSDFDFNDIVFDVIQKPNGNQECIVRALGGIYNIEISIGGANGSTWKKSDAVADFTQMMNTLDPEYTKIVNKEMDPVIARFDIKNNAWLPAENNVVVTVYPSEYQSIRLPFPEDGVVPFMVAVKPTKMWNPEYMSVNDVPGWFSDAE